MLGVADAEVMVKEERTADIHVWRSVIAVRGDWR